MLTQTSTVFYLKIEFKFSRPPVDFKSFKSDHKFYCHLKNNTVTYKDLVKIICDHIGLYNLKQLFYRPANGPLNTTQRFLIEKDSLRNHSFENYGTFIIIF